MENSFIIIKNESNKSKKIAVVAKITRLKNNYLVLKEKENLSFVKYTDNQNPILKKLSNTETEYVTEIVEKLCKEE
jgi:hypothetical protein